jgi:hypothetical protein
MTVPSFLLASNNTKQEQLFVVHTEFPCFILNVISGEIKWIDELNEDLEESEVMKIVDEAFDFYEKEIKILEKM